ncbi:hypothetical protein [Virgisporangium aurantiacum]|uniref:Uncharacterized protein n=1 Tax=Virgisporangium aurantiacum TaxID=175570 RepID=A0A8J3Z7D2_9ACTN|nr:hypothetical protein [Virgisporangium aurantiacum]GIJ56285.1 hypothetical protein Vau01_038010 [Virgisporangium aurantiacum]
MNDLNAVTRAARVRDEDLAGMESDPAARALFDTIVTDTDHVAARRFTGRRIVLVAAAVVVVGAAAVFGPGLLGDRPGGAASYANDAIDIRREGRFLVARIKDPLADRERFTEAFRAVGKKVTITLVPVSPRYVGQLLSSGSSANRTTHVETEFEPTGGGRVDCAVEPLRCTLTIRISIDTTSTVQYTFGRAARPGEALQDPSRDPGSGPTVSGPGASAGGGN